MFNFSFIGKKEINIAVFGKGYGESIVVHVGGHHFVVVDSFINNETKRPIALDYLEGIGCSANNIIGVILTHWDDDHCRGIADLVEKSNSQIDVYVPIPFNTEKSLKFLFFYKDHSEKPTSEMNKLLFLNKNGKIKLIPCFEDQLLCMGKMPKLKDKIGKILTFSPDSKLIYDFIEKIIIPEVNCALPENLPGNNFASIITHFDLVYDSILLSGDFQNSGSKTWAEISDKYKDESKCHIYKISHHGSENGYGEEIFNKLVEKPIGIITRFNHGALLPKDEMIEKYKNKCSKLLIIGKKPKTKEIVDEILDLKSDLNISKINDNTVGAAILTKKNGSEWTVETFGHVEEFNFPEMQSKK